MGFHRQHIESSILREKTRGARLERIRDGMEKEVNPEKICAALKDMGCWGYGERIVKQTIRFLKDKKLTEA